jgi:diacylglycerol kinase family enzyme
MLLHRHFPHRPVVFVANPAAGTRHRHRVVARIARQRCGGEGRMPEIWWTASGEEARRRVRERLDRSGGAPPIVVSLGGDGTHNHVLQAGMEGNGGALFLRLPLGSGNDAAGTASLRDALDELEGAVAPVRIPAVRITGQRSSHVAFNIASVGIDAYVTILHDRWRKILPGNTYRLLVDLAVLRYDRALAVGPLGIAVRTPGGGILDLGAVPRSLVALGATGHRTYGDHMAVLPGDENLCVIARTGLFDKMRMKGLFYRGAHVDQPITSMHRATGITLSYDGRMPLQFDGETRWLEGGDFPLRMEIEADAVPVLALARVAENQNS